MNIRMKLLAVVSAIVGIYLLTACSDSRSGHDAAGMIVTETAAAEKPIEIKWAGIYPPDTDYSYAQQFLEKKFNIKLINIRLDQSVADQQLNVKLASGEIPDMIPGVTDINGYVYMVKQGIAAELPIEEIRQYMPNYSKFIDELDPSFWDIGQVDGKNYGIPRTFGDGDAYLVPSYNAVWLKAIGYDAPPSTLAELEDVLTKFRFGDPDGNGKLDTYGLSLRGKDTLGTNLAFNTVFGAYGVNPHAWNLVDGSMQFGITTEGARQAFKTLNRWYKSGILDPEFITDDWNRYKRKFLSGQTGLLDQAMWYNIEASGSLGGDAIKANMKFVVGQPLLGPDGKRHAVAHGIGQVPVIISSEAYKDVKKRIKIYQLLDALAMDPETYLAVGYGEEGVHYDLVDGAAVPRPEYTDQQRAGAVAGIGLFYGMYKTNTLVQLGRTKSQADFRASVVRPDVVRLYDMLPHAVLSSWTANQNAISKIIKEYEIKFVTGIVDTDKGFDDFVALLNMTGLQAATEEANKLYAERSKR